MNEYEVTCPNCEDIVVVIASADSDDNGFVWTDVQIIDDCGCHNTEFEIDEFISEICKQGGQLDDASLAMAEEYASRDY